MSMHGSFIMIQGNHLTSLPEVFSRFKYIPTIPPKQINGWKETYKAVHDPRISGKSNTVVHKAACYINNWTIIYDAEGLMVSDEAFCSSISNWLNARLVGVICEGTSNTYAYINCDGNSIRSFWIGDGEIFKDSGEKFPEEPATQNIDEPDVLEIMSRLGVDPQKLDGENNFYLFELDESNMGASKPINNAPIETPQKKKSWWRFW